VITDGLRTYWHRSKPPFEAAASPHQIYRGCTSCWEGSLADVSVSDTAASALSSAAAHWEAHLEMVAAQQALASGRDVSSSCVEGLIARPASITHNATIEPAHDAACAGLTPLNHMQTRDNSICSTTHGHNSRRSSNTVGRVARQLRNRTQDLARSALSCCHQLVLGRSTASACACAPATGVVELMAHLGRFQRTLRHAEAQRTYPAAGEKSLWDTAHKETFSKAAG
jgi:hypothetical protein